MNVYENYQIDGNDFLYCFVSLCSSKNLLSIKPSDLKHYIMLLTRNNSISDLKKQRHGIYFKRWVCVYRLEFSCVMLSVASFGRDLSTALVLLSRDHENPLLLSDDRIYIRATNAQAKGTGEGNAYPKTSGHLLQPALSITLLVCLYVCPSVCLPVYLRSPLPISP